MLDCRTSVPFKPKYESVMLMFKVKVTSSKFFDTSSSLTNCELIIIHGNPSVGIFSTETLHI